MEQQILELQDEIETLKGTIEDRENEIRQPEEKVDDLSGSMGQIYDIAKKH